MLCQSYEVIGQHLTRPSLRWKEWIPLMSQQLRLRNLIQIFAFNVSLEDHNGFGENVPRNSTTIGQLVKSKHVKSCNSFYYTLHLTTMSAPFYTSEKLEHEHPKWSEIETTNLLNKVNAAVTGIVVRLWTHQENEPDHMITMWGVYFSGLIYLGPDLCLDPSTLQLNTIIFSMQGGYFTAAEYLKVKPSKYRSTAVELSHSDVKASYKVNALLSLHSKQQAIKNHMLAAQDLREKITVGGYTPKPNENSILQRLLNESRPKIPKRQDLLKAREAVELARFQVEMLTREKSRKQAEFLDRERIKVSLGEANLDRGLDLMSKYQNLHKDIERLKDWRKSYIDTRETYLHTKAQLSFRQKQLIAELNQIYPVVQFSENKFSICGLHLPNSDNFVNSDDVMVSVALGFVAHLVQMIAVFLQVPLRYPINHFSSMSKITDHVADKIPDKDREFPLFLRGRDRLQFNYGVYLLNKNIAQLRFYCGIATRELPATLPNLLSLLHRPGTNGLDFSHRSMSGSSLDLRSSSQNMSPVASLQSAVLRRHTPSSNRHFEKGHRASKSTGSSDIKFSLKIAVPEIQSAEELSIPDTVDLANSNSVSNNLSYSLDKGLDEYEDLKKAEVSQRPPKSVSAQQSTLLNQGFLGSEPILTPDMLQKIKPLSLKDEAQKKFLQIWQAGGGPGQICSDDDYDVSQRPSARSVPTVPSANSTASLSAANIENSTQIQVKHSTRKSQQNSCNESDADDRTNQENVIGVLTSELELEMVDRGLESVPTSNVLQSPTNEDRHKETDMQSYEEENVDSVVVGEECDTVFDSDTCLAHPSERSDNGVQKQYLEGQSIDGMSDLFFANVASRTEALASRNTSFNRVRSRHSGSGSLDD